MKRNLLLIIFFSIFFNTFAQTPKSEMLLKYWSYRDRLKYFVIPGTKQGESEIIDIRNAFKSPCWNSASSSFGQQGIYFGYYIGFLATEYYLLNQNGQTNDAQASIAELTLALDQYDNWMDKCEYYWQKPNILDGLFVRENVPCDFLDSTSPAGNGFTVGGLKHIDLLNQNLSYKANLWNDTTKTFGNLPRGHPGWSGSITVGGCSGDKKELMSQDEAIGVLLGLALVKKFIPSGTLLHERSISTACHIISYIQNTQLPPQGFWPWTIYDPDGNTVSAGASAIFNSFGFWQASRFFDNNCVSSDITSETFQLIWQAQQFYQSPLYYNSTMASTLAAIGNSWQIGITVVIGICPFCITFNIAVPSTGMGIYINNKKEDNETFYLILYDLLNDKSSDRLDMNKLSTQLQGAPCEGPYDYQHDGTNGIHADGGWASSYRWHKENCWQNGQVNCPDHSDEAKGDIGNFNGLDYMLAYNLYRLKTSDEQPAYIKYDNRLLTGTVNSPTEFLAFNSIASTQLINPTLPSVIYKASDNIKLEPGFHSANGSNFHAFIEAIDCNTPLNDKKRNPKTILSADNEIVIDTLPCTNDTLHFNGIDADTTGEMFTYYWDFGNGQVSKNRKVDVFYSEPGSYLVTLLLSDTLVTFLDTVRFILFKPICSTKKIKSDYQNNTGSAVHQNDQMANESRVTIIPNPNNGNMQVDYFLANQNYAIFEIYNLSGHKLYSQILLPENSSILVSKQNLSAGVYMYRVVQNENVIASDKIVIIK